FIGPALLAGRSCVVLVAPEIALSAEVVAEGVRAAGLPDGLVTILPGSAAAVDTLVRSHADLAAAVHGSRLLPVTVLAPDAALVPFLTALPARCLAGNGQYGCDETCVLVPREQHAETVEAVTA